MAKHWTVGEVARIARVSVRTLHHYDEIGLVVPSRRSHAGYRLYGDEDLDRLHQVLLYRELGLQLEAVAQLLDDPALDRRAALRAQRAALEEKLRRTEGLIHAVDRALDSIERGKTMSADEKFEGFASPDAPEDVRSHQPRYAAEVGERWGDTAAYRESMRRARAYTKQDWTRIREEGEAIEEAMAELLRAGRPATAVDAMDLAEQARRHISRAYYECSPRMHAGLADMYEADPRFAAHYEKRQKGLAGFMAAAIRANAERIGGGSRGGGMQEPPPSDESERRGS